MIILTDIRQTGKTTKAIQHIAKQIRYTYFSDNAPNKIYIQVIHKNISEALRLSERIKDELRLGKMSIYAQKMDETFDELLSNINSKDDGIYIIARKLDNVMLSELNSVDYTLIDDFKITQPKKENIVITTIVE